MDKFEIFLEKRIKNPLRKQDLASREVPNNKEYVDSQVKEFEKTSSSKSPDIINQYKQSLVNDYIRTSITPDKYKFLFEKNGMKFYLDKQDLDKWNPRWNRHLMTSVKMFLNDIKGLVPNRKPKFVVKNLQRDERLKGEDGLYPPAIYEDRVIYLDLDSIDNHEYLTHEYAHYLADLIPNQTEQLLQKEYSNMIDNYFREIKKRKRLDLEGNKNATYRKNIAKKLGFPTDYAFTNFSEFFAEILRFWKKLPNNTATYRFKQAIKSTLARL